MHTEVYEGIDSVDRATWDALMAGSPFTGAVWCKFSETIQHTPAYYAIVFNDDTPIGGAIYTVMYDEATPSTSRLLHWFLRTYLKRRPLLVCRTAPTTDHRGFVVPGDPAQRAAVVSEIARVGQNLLKRHHGSFFLADYITPGELGYDWGDLRKIADFANIGMALAVEWESWDDYMAHLKRTNKKMHKNVRNNLRYAEDAGITVQVTHHMPPLDEVTRLVTTKMAHYDVPFDSDDVRHITRSLTVLKPEHYAWIVAHHEGRMVGVELMLNDPTTGVCKPTLYGRDYTVEYVYFAMSFEDIRYAIEDLKAQKIVYDTEAYDFKRRLGMVEDPRNNLVLYPGSWGERGLVNVLMRFMND